MLLDIEENTQSGNLTKQDWADFIIAKEFLHLRERQAGTFSDGGLVICGPPPYKHANGPLFGGHKGPPGEDQLTLNTESLPGNLNFIGERDMDGCEYLAWIPKMEMVETIAAPSQYSLG